MSRSKGVKSKSVSLKLAQNYRVISCAYHEAAHTICALLHFMRVLETAIDESVSRVSGYTDYDPIVIETEFEKIGAQSKDYVILSEIYLKYAGLAGEKIYFKDISGSDKFPVVLKFGTEPDMEDAANLIKKYNLAPPGNKRYLLKKKMFRHITALLKKYWPDIKIIAHKLYDKRKLQEDDLRQLLTRKSPNKRFWKKQFKNISLLSKNVDKTDLERTLFR